MSINAKLDQLYKEWAKDRDSFVKGGVVDENAYLNSSPRVLMLLKEVNSEHKKWSLVDLIHDQLKSGNFYDIWDTIGIWNLALSDGLKPYREVRYMANLSRMYDGLNHIATTNLKKSIGGGESVYDEIREHALKDKDYLVKEINIISPDLIICGGTYSILKVLMGLEDRQCQTGAIYSIINDKVVILDMPHPNARVSKQIVYAYFKETLTELIENKVIPTHV